MKIEKSNYLQEDSLKSFIVNGLETDGGHHKQWYLEQILFRLGFNPNKIREEERKEGYDWENGVAPWFKRLT